MLTQLTTVKARLGIADEDVSNDPLLTNTILAVSEIFEKECNRVFGRAENVTQEFDADETEIILARYPLETVSVFETKISETAGWVTQSGVDYLIRNACVVSLNFPIGSRRQRGRITYTAGYVLPGAGADTGQTPLPNDLEQATVEQVATWFQNKDKLGLIRYWPKGGIYLQFMTTDVIPTVRSVLDRYKRIVI